MVNNARDKDGGTSTSVAAPCPAKTGLSRSPSTCIKSSDVHLSDSRRGYENAESHTKLHEKQYFQKTEIAESQSFTRRARDTITLVIQRSPMSHNPPGTSSATRNGQAGPSQVDGAFQVFIWIAIEADAMRVYDKPPATSPRQEPWRDSPPCPTVVFRTNLWKSIQEHGAERGLCTYTEVVHE
jgi:hypothetical protein